MVDPGAAHLSDTLFTAAIAVYSAGLVSYCGEYAFGRRGRVAESSRRQERALAAATAPAARSAGATVAVLDRPPLGSADGAAGTDRAGRADGTGEPDRSRPGAQRFGRAAVLLTALGLLLHATSVVLRGTATGRWPWGNMYEYASAVGVVAVAAFLVVVIRYPRVRYLGMFVMLPVISLMFLAGTVLYARAAPLVPALRSYWIAIHVTSAILATGIFMVSFVATVLYLIRARWDRMVATGRRPTRFPTTLGWRLPPAELLDRIAYRTVAFAFPIFTFGVIAGAIWAEAAWGRYWGWDPKETWAFITWVGYAAYLHARATAGWRGTAAARVNAIAFTTMIFNFFVVNMVVSGLHSYAGLS